MDYKKILYQFIASLTLAEHMGDVSNDVMAVLDFMGDDELSDSDWYTLRQLLHERGITTLFGTEVGNYEEDNN